MKLLLSAFILGLSITGLVFGQVTVTETVVNTGPLQTGFAVVTPVAGTGEGLSVSETFGEQIGANLFQTSVLGSPLVTLTDVVVSVDSTNGFNTGVAMVNPNLSLANVTLTLGNQQGATIGTRTITIGAHQQISEFATELFSGDPNVAQGLTGLLFISSDMPIGVVGLAFSGGTFTALPVASQLSGNNVITTQTAAGSIATATRPVTSTFGLIAVPVTTPTTVSAPLTPTFNGVPTPPTLLPPPVIPIFPTTPITGSAIPLVTSTGPVTGTQFTTTPVSSFALATQNVVPSFTFTFPQLIAGVGGTGALLLPQVATGGGWTSQITIANTSATTQTVRVDFLNPLGGPLPSSLGSTVPNIVIPPGGVATLRL
jgi:hypothetical protein